MFHRWSFVLFVVACNTQCFGFIAPPLSQTRVVELTGGNNGFSSSSSSTSLQLSPGMVGLGTVGVGIVSLWIYFESAPTRVLQRQRQRQRQRESQEDVARSKQWEEERKQRAYIEPREFWTESDLKEYDGSQDDGNGPILFAADGIVFNVWKGRQFYAPGGEYHIFAGRDATRLLARTLTEEETEDDAQKPLTMGERAALAGWVWTFKNKYDIVGKLDGFDDSTTSMKM